MEEQGKDTSTRRGQQRGKQSQTPRPQLRALAQLSHLGGGRGETGLLLSDRSSRPLLSLSPERPLLLSLDLDLLLLLRSLLEALLLLLLLLRRSLLFPRSLSLLECFRSFGSLLLCLCERDDLSDFFSLSFFGSSSCFSSMSYLRMCVYKQHRSFCNLMSKKANDLADIPNSTQFCTNLQ